MTNNTASAETRGEISGVYEICIGTNEPDSALKYWEQFGFKKGVEGELSPEEAEKLYGV